MSQLPPAPVLPGLPVHEPEKCQQQVEHSCPERLSLLPILTFWVTDVFN